MAQLVKCLPCKHEVPDWLPRIHPILPGLVGVGVCLSFQCWERRGKTVSGTPCPGSQA